MHTNIYLHAHIQATTIYLFTHAYMLPLPLIKYGFINAFFCRLVMAYENGLIIIWDASEDRVVLVRGSKDLKVKEKAVTNSPEDTTKELSDATEESKQVEKEISSLCWVSDNGSILAVGYVDGDIMLWDLSTAASTKDQKSEKLDNNVAKLQLSSGDRRLPVIVLHWSANRLDNHHRGQLFVYGGDDIGSQEVLTVRC